MLIELKPGKPTWQAWRKMTMAAKIWMVEQMADFQSQIFRHEFQSIGTLLLGEGEAPDTAAVKPGRVVMQHYFQDERYDIDILPSPYRSTYDWLHAYISLLQQQQQKLILEYAVYQEYKDDATATLSLADNLAALLPKIFPAMVAQPKQTVLLHSDLSLANIVVDDDGKVTAVVDWECCGLDGHRAPPKHLIHYETTQLRKIYTAKMKELWLQWEVEEVNDGFLRRDFPRAIQRCAVVRYLPSCDRL
ncbi:hypothetical protein B0T25DRAFT_591390 [Lasiosphaeria hispida]|uniref:Aminoglycoside phosphotransferase domain-containing protein n=1 Tax=Lasiosphaeria hispida TaxID=260671 RepID=A0AAJ0HDN1_9PEZI|nr:hypothetical protein B0T25DRAFT_591390 [Lasiosphaeria hispida]